MSNRRKVGSRSKSVRDGRKAACTFLRRSRGYILVGLEPDGGKGGDRGRVRYFAEVQGLDAEDVRGAALRSLLRDTARVVTEINRVDTQVWLEESESMKVVAAKLRRSAEYAQEVDGDASRPTVESPAAS